MIANSTEVIHTYNVTSLRKDPSYITIYVNWFLLFATGIIPMGSLMYLNSRIYAKILETRRLRERCRINTGTVMALKELKPAENGQNGEDQNDPKAPENEQNGQIEATPPPQDVVAKRHEAMSAKDIKMARVLLSIVLVFFVCHLLR